MKKAIIVAMLLTVLFGANAGAVYAGNKKTKAELERKEERKRSQKLFRHEEKIILIRECNHNPNDKIRINGRYKSCKKILEQFENSKHKK